MIPAQRLASLHAIRYTLPDAFPEDTRSCRIPV
jgi:hypothetical protein